ncbi:amylosucrase [Reinekea marinisedimentorum]|uniref:Amylosucrase n=1 Tax=Reinekea marinisedimentorum TaxID=230495 RepID=A0A4R3HXK1_9GAMM|nr:amylosucrase [Reinekea marinisedimentorum]TCS36159.1 amylosucrase [Reinekea marinisedimentorum]
MTLGKNNEHPALLALERIWPDVDAQYSSHRHSHRLVDFKAALVQDLPALFDCLYDLYQNHWDFYYQLKSLVMLAANHWFATAKDQRPYSWASACWIEDERNVGFSAYVDLFAGNLNGLEKKIPYLKNLGINYIHLMPFFETGEGDSDGGYAVKDYGNVNPRVGTLEDLHSVAEKLHQNDIRLVLDFVFNHTSDQHDWVVKAKSGDQFYQQFYWLFDNPEEKNQYAHNLRDIFPDKRLGCFSWCEELQCDVWTTFNDFQWDLNYCNPNVFYAMCGEMMKLANAGADVIRLDALAFTWKEPGTSCENLPKAHRLIQAFNAFLRISAPNILFKSEAIVAPDDVVEYISEDECALSYNPNMMALIWEALATRETKLLIEGSRYRTQLPEHTVWVNYLRCHDDIGWAFADQDSWDVSINPHHHRSFLNQFYTGKFEGSFSTGLPFQENPFNGDCRICGTMASLCGLELGFAQQNPILTDHAYKRMLVINGVLLAFKGIPLIYAGDEQAMLNDYSFQQHPAHHNDQRWVHRIPFNKINSQLSAEQQHQSEEFYTSMKELIRLRKTHAVFGAGDITIYRQIHPHLFVFSRSTDTEVVYILANFSEHQFSIHHDQLDSLNLSPKAVDLINNGEFSTAGILQFGPYQMNWLYQEKSKQI